MKTLKEVVEHFKSGPGSFKIRLFNDADNKLLSSSDKILASDKLDKFEVTTISMNELFMTYDLRIKAIKEEK